VIDAADTPQLTVDLDAVDRNIARMQAAASALGLAFRPHVKTHKLPLVAARQVAAGAVGITCQKLTEAEAMIDAGLDDVLVTFPVVGVPKLRRLVDLARRARVSVTVDAPTAARQLSAALAAAGTEVGVLVDCDTGYGRTGVRSPTEAAELAALVAQLPGLRLEGLTTYPTPTDGGAWVAATREEFAARGLEARRVSGGGTLATYRMTAADGLTEVRAGTYVYGDRTHVVNGAMRLEDCALHVRATVVSRPTSDRAILDAGSKALTNDPVEADGYGGHGIVLEYPDAVIERLSEEHGHVDVSACPTRPEVGEVVRVVPNHACGAVNLYDRVTLLRAGDVPRELMVAARGCSR
jgi:D-serine deaminase-like pyridoxal phosphate-dependent protein